jgi:hypothetical protein
MIQALGARNMAEMLRITGFSTAAGSTWRKRGSVPDGSIARIAGLSNVSFEWLKFGRGEMVTARMSTEEKHPGQNLAGLIVAEAQYRQANKGFYLSAEEAAILEMLRDLSEEERKYIESQILTAWVACRRKKE